MQGTRTGRINTELKNVIGGKSNRESAFGYGKAHVHPPTMIFKAVVYSTVILGESSVYMRNLTKSISSSNGCGILS
jgi:hypothetical protein